MSKIILYPFNKLAYKELFTSKNIEFIERTIAILSYNLEKNLFVYIRKLSNTLAKKLYMGFILQTFYILT